jgi:hypothetical protein
MEKHRYLGIDESNHGRFPEIIVGVCSPNPAEVSFYEQALSKKRKTKSAFTYAKRDEFRHVLLPEDSLRFGSIRGLRLVAIAELIKYFSPVERAVFDGQVAEEDLNALEITLGQKMPLVMTMTKGDEHIPLVHRADAIASSLFRYYGRTKCRKIAQIKRQSRAQKYLGTLITPRLEDYADLLKRIH